MGPRRRRWQRGAAKAALVALGLAVLGLVGSGGGEELLAAALAAWGEGRGVWGAVGGGEGRGEAWGGRWGGDVVNGGGGGRGNGAGFVNGGGGGRGNGAGFVNGAAAFVNGEGAARGGAGLGVGLGGGEGGPGVFNGSWGVTKGGPASPARAPRVPPGCFGLLSGGSGDLDEGPQVLATPKILLSPPPCSPPAPFLLTLVPSAPSHVPQRLAVRDTWGGPWEASGTPPGRTVFVLGAAASPAGQRELLREWRQHGDILQGDFGDTYGNLTWKTLLLLRWARACCGDAPFLLKADDDVFVNAPAVATYLAAWPAPPARLYLGRVHWRVAPNRDPRSRHHVPERLYPGRLFPPYCSGTAYVLSRQAAIALLAAAPRVPLVGPEDVWVGLCARRAGVAPRHSARFGGSRGFAGDGCCVGGPAFSAHRVGPRGLRGLWARLRGRGGCAELPALLGLLRCRALALLGRGLGGSGGWGGEG